MTISPTVIPGQSLYVSQLDPKLAERALASDLTSPAKLALLYVLCHPVGTLVARDDLADVYPSVAQHLNAVLDEVVDARWLVTVPAGEPPCCAEGFQLRPDEDPGQDAAPPRVTHLGAGVTWVTGEHGSDGRG